MDVRIKEKNLSEELLIEHEKEEEITVEDKDDFSGFVELQDDTTVQDIKSDADKNKESNKNSIKRKKTMEDNEAFNKLTDVFLRVIYPLTHCMSKSIIIGIFKHLDYAPGVILNQSGKIVLFTEKGWYSLSKYLQLIECYILNNVYGKKTSLRLEDTDIEV